MARTCLALNQINMLSILTPDIIAIETRRLSEKAAREADMREMAEAKLEAQKIASAAAARRKDRKCLSCGDSFPSEHAGHRICSPCKDLEIFASSPSSFSVHASF